MINEQQIKNVHKIILVGDAGTGKTNIVYAFCKQKIPNNLVSTIAVEYSTKTINIDNKKIRLQIWDTAGQQQYRAITMNYYRNMSAAFIVFDLSRRKTFESIPFWIENLQEKGEKHLKIAILGHKSDVKRREVNEQQAQQFAKRHNCIYSETTTKDISTISSAFTKLVSNLDFSKPSDKNNNLQLHAHDHQAQGCSC